MSLILKLIAVFFMVTASLPAMAQEATSTPAVTPALPGILRLTDTADQYDLGPYIFITADDSERLIYKDLIEGHLGTHRGANAEQNLISLGTQTKPHWMIVSIRNDTRARTNWILSLGNHGDGAYGALSKLFVYDHLSKKYLLYAMPDKAGKLPATDTLPMNGETIPVSIASGQQMMLVMYMMPEGGALTTITPKLMTEQAFWRAQNNPLAFQSVVILTLVTAIGFFIGLLAFRRKLTAIPILLYISAQLGLYLYQNQVHFSDAWFASESTFLILGISVILGLIASRFFLGIGSDNKTEGMVLNGVSAVMVIIGAVTVLLIPENSVIRPALLVMIPIAGLIVLLCLSMAQAITGKTGALLFGSGWAIILAGMVVTGLTLLNILPDTIIFVRAYWIAVLIQSVILIISSIYQSWVGEQSRKKIEQNAEEDAENISLVRQAKDSSENARLLRVIDHERQMLQDLRDRELQQNEEMRAAKETADMANRAKSAFLAVISHEIRTPMSGIMGMVRLMLDTQLTRDQKDYARTIQDSGDAMLALLNDILDFEKIETGKMDLEIVDFDLSRLVNDIMTLMSGHASHKKISLNADIQADVPRFVRGDPVRLRQVLLNLTGNAIKFTSDGSVTLTVKLAGSENASQPGWVKLYFGVRDSGIGISKDAQKNLFSPFAQADSSISRKYGGSGLGLAICQRLIEAMGSKILIDSTEGEGSTFYFSIAMEEGQADQIEESDSISRGSLSQKAETSLTILCVDDNEVNQKLMREFVGRQGHTPVLAGSGEEAIDLVRAQDFDMVLMDIQLPGISGMGATRAIRALPDARKASIPVIALTGNVQSEDVHNCYAANMNGHLAKPIDPDKLRVQIDKVIHGNLDNPVSLEDQVTELRPTEVKIDIDDIDIPQNDDHFTLDDNSEIAKADVAPIHAFAYGTNDSETKTLPATTELELSTDDQDFESFRSPATPAQTSLSLSTTEEISSFDYSLLSDLKRSMKPADLRDMIASLTEKIEEILPALSTALDSNDIPAILSRAHELKGMCANFGLQEMSLLAEQIEEAVNGDESIDGLHDIIFMLPDAYDRARAAINTWMES